MKFPFFKRRTHDILGGFTKLQKELNQRLKELGVESSTIQTKRQRLAAQETVVANETKQALTAIEQLSKLI